MEILAHESNLSLTTVVRAISRRILFSFDDSSADRGRYKKKKKRNVKRDNETLFIYQTIYIRNYSYAYHVHIHIHIYTCKAYTHAYDVIICRLALRCPEISRLRLLHLKPIRIPKRIFVQGMTRLVLRIIEFFFILILIFFLFFFFLNFFLFFKKYLRSHR